MWEILFVAFCILLNAVLAGVEIAFITVDKALLKQRAQEGDERAQGLLELKKRPERTLSTIQIGITLLAALSAAVGGAAAGINIMPLLQDTFGMSKTVSEITSVLLVVAPIAYLSIVVGEITPKALALRSPYFFASFGTVILNLLNRLLLPLVKLCEKSTKGLLKLIPMQNVEEGVGEKRYREYENLLASYRLLPRKGKEYMFNLGEIRKKRVKDILLEWSEVGCVSADLELSEIVEKTIASGHTRFPVLKEGRVVGLINTKEILALTKSRIGDWRDLMHPPVVFKKEASLLDALAVLQNRHVHMGIVEGEEGAPLGIVTIEDIIEEVLGEIYDEDDSGSLQRILSS